MSKEEEIEKNRLAGRTVMSDEASSVEPAATVPTDPDSLYGTSGRPNYHAKRQMQSGIEKKHEGWVMETLNFLQALDIPFYTYHPNGDRDPKRDKDIPERLKIVLNQIYTLRTDLRKANTTATEAEKQLRNVRGSLAEKQDVLHRIATMDESAAMVIFFDLRKAAAEKAEEAAKLEGEALEKEAKDG
jgi:hypothetical protein